MMLIEPTSADPVFFHFPYGIYVVNVDVGATIPDGDKEILRGLAHRVAAVAAKPVQNEKRALWTAHNDLKTKRPVILCDPEGGWNEIIPASEMRCESPIGRVWEMRLRMEAYWGEEMGDDKVVDDVFFVPYAHTTNCWGMPYQTEGDVSKGEAIHYKTILEDYDRDLPKLRMPEVTLYREKTERLLSLAHDVFDGILRVELRGTWWWSFGFTGDIIKIRGLDNLLYDFYDYPDELHRLMRFWSDGAMSYLDWLVDNNLVSTNVGNVYIGSGGFGFTDELPAKPDPDNRRAQPMEMWGFSESQETVGVSEEFFEEFILRYQMPLLERFGLNYYGCCEPLDQRMDAILKIPRLRRLSCSAWADLGKMSERLGDRYVMAVKPNPATISRPTFDRELVRKNIRDILESTRGSVVELIMKDNHTLGGRGENARDWCATVREVVDSFV